MTIVSPSDQARILADIMSDLDTLEASIPRTDAARSTTVGAARRLNRAAGTLATSVLLDSAVEHYRASFANPAMYTPLVVSAMTLATSAHGTADARPAAHRTRQMVYSAAAATGLMGTGFHLYNVLKRPGRLTWQNLFFGAPIGAPMAILLAGLLGAAAEEVRNTPDAHKPRVLGLRADRLLAVVSGLGMLGTAGEAGLLHFRGAFHNPVMFAPVTIPPIGAALLLNTAARKTRRGHWLTRWWLRLTALLGVVGAGFHVWGVQRNMGGWRNWSQNVLNGPPIPAPPSFTGLALAGLAALGLSEDNADA